MQEKSKTTQISSIGTVRTFLKVGACSETLCNVLDRAYDHPLQVEEHASMPLAGGLMRGYQCGMLWGAALAAGAQVYHQFGAGEQAEMEAVLTAQRLVETFRSHYKYINCYEITRVDWHKPVEMWGYLLRGGPIKCFSMSASYAKQAHREINDSLAAEKLAATAQPQSCAAALARKLGASDLHTLMVAGFAGGIGLSGGACGALGAAIWFAMMAYAKEGVKENELEPPQAKAAMDKFLEITGNVFECSKIVGRKFENVADHAAYLCEGGCAKIIEGLAALN